MSGALAGRVALLALAVIALDQAAKALARAQIGRGESHHLLLGIDLVQVRNEGVAFGLLEGNATLVLVVTLVALAGLLAFLLTRPPHGGQWIAVGLLAGGAAGNLIDRLAAGEVTDFIDPPAWPAFNVADIAITVGIIWLILTELRGPRRTRAS